MMCLVDGVDSSMDFPSVHISMIISVRDTVHALQMTRDLVDRASGLTPPTIMVNEVISSVLNTSL